MYAGLALAAALALGGSASFFESESLYQRQYRDPYLIAQQFPRLEGVRTAVPESAVMGYLTDTSPGSTVFEAMYGSARYVLAPRLVRLDTNAAWVLGNFTRPADFAALARRNGLRLERDFGNGVLLFRKEGTR